MALLLGDVAIETSHSLQPTFFGHECKISQYAAMVFFLLRIISTFKALIILSVRTTKTERLSVIKMQVLSPCDPAFPLCSRRVHGKYAIYI